MNERKSLACKDADEIVIDGGVYQFAYQGPKVEEQEPTCETCRFWETHDDKVGECRRYPPSFAANKLQFDEQLKGFGKDGVWKGWWPETVALEWCGEWKKQNDTATTQETPEEAQDAG